MALDFPNKRVLCFDFDLLDPGRMDTETYVKLPNPAAPALAARMSFRREKRLSLVKTFALTPARMATVKPVLDLVAWFFFAYQRLTHAEDLHLRQEIARVQPKKMRDRVMQLTNPWIEAGKQEGLQQGLQQGIATLIAIVHSMTHTCLRTRTARLIAGILVLTCGTLSAGERPFTYFRSDGGVADPAAGSLPGHLDSPDALRWRTPLDSGHSTPILCNGRIFLTTYSHATAELATLALTAKTGRLVWKRIAPAVRIEEVNRETGNPAQATPACDGERLYVFFGSRGLICYDLEGRQLWEQRMGPFQDEYGSASSPILVEDKVVIQQDHDVGSFLMALDRKTGRILWNKKRPDAVRSYSTPAVWSRNGRNELLVAGALELAGYDPSNGERLWWIDGLARIVIPAPLPSGDMVYMASWAPGGDSEKRTSLDPWPAALRKWDKNGDDKLATNEVDNPDVIDRFFRMDLDQSGDLAQEEWERHAAVFRRAQNGVLAVKPSTGVGALGESAVVWRCPRGAPYVATPLVDRGIFWMVKDGGIVTKIMAATGRVLQVERLQGLGNYYASPVSADGKVYFASQQGFVSVVANEPGWRVIAAHDFKEKIYATPVVEAGCLFIRTEKALYCFQTPR